MSGVGLAAEAGAGGGEQGDAVIGPQGRRAQVLEHHDIPADLRFLFQEQVSGLLSMDTDRLLTGFPATDDAVLLTSELCGNTITHSASGQPAGIFTLRARAQGITHLLAEVEDKGRLVCRRSGRC